MTILTNPFMFPPSSLYGEHSFWRLFMTNNHGGSGIILSEMEMRAAPGGVDQCTGGTATASDTSAGNSPANVFDNNPANFNYWDSASVNQWAAYQFPAPVGVEEVALTMPPSGAANPITRAPKDCKIQYSDDGVSYTDAFSFSVYANLVGQVRVFPEPEPEPGYHRMYRLFVVSTAGGAIQITEIQMRATSGGADQTVSVPSGDGNASGRAIYSAAGSGSEGYRVFDNNAGTWWYNASGANQWVGFVFPNPVKVEELVIQGSTVAANRSPANFRLEYSDDGGATWTTQKTYSGVTWALSETKTLSAL